MQAAEVVGEPKIDDLDHSRGLPSGKRNHDVFGFQISMYDSQGVQVLDSYNHLIGDHCGFPFAEFFIFLNVLEKVFSLDKLGDDIDSGFGLDGLLVLDQERVTQD